MTASQERFVASAIAAALDVPAVGIEADAWIARNLAEVALMLYVSDQSPEPLDDLVREFDLRGAPDTFCTRLFGLRELLGRVPTWYPRHGSDRPARRSLSQEDEQAATAMLRFAATLDALPPSAPLMSSSSGNGERAYLDRSTWRPTTPAESNRPTFRQVEIPQSMLWRAWLIAPDLGVVRVVVDEQLSPEAMDIWWGVHDGTHLDHLTYFAFSGPAPIEFGRGLMIAESLAMVVELLAAAEALAEERSGTISAVRNGLIERVGRLPIECRRTQDLGELTDLFEFPVQSEFGALPTLASAYVLGPIRLIARGFRSPYIPIAVTQRLLTRWHSAEAKHAAVRRLGEDARGMARTDVRQ